MKTCARAAASGQGRSRAAQVQRGSLGVVSEVATLELQAAQLRGEIEELETVRAEQQLLERKRGFDAFDIDGSGSLCATKLRRGLQETMGIEVCERKASRLVRMHDRNGDGALQLEEFDLSALQASLEGILAEERAEEDAARAAEAERQAKLELERQMEEYRKTLPGANQDTGPVTRVLCALPYVLPLVDALSFGLPLGVIFEPSMTYFAPVVVLYWIVSAIPFGQLLLFLGLQWLARNEELPALLRFNLQQAIQLDIVLIVPTLVKNFSGGDIFNAVSDKVGLAVFLPGVVLFAAVLASIAYSVGCSLGGVAPRGLPFVSAWAEKAMGMSPPDAEATETARP